MAAKHCSGRYVADVTLLELKKHQFEIVLKSENITLQGHMPDSRCNLVSLKTHFDKDSCFQVGCYFDISTIEEVLQLF